MTSLSKAVSQPAAPDYPGPGVGEVVIEVTPGQTVSQVGQTLKDEGVIKSTQAFFEVAAEVHYATAMDTRFVVGGFTEPGPATACRRSPTPGPCCSSTPT